MVGYYKLGAVREALPDRLRAIREVIPKGSTVLDLGCNDGCIGRALQESGHASRVVGVDLQRAADYQGQEFLAFDLRNGDLELLPDADVVLCLNVVHHLLLQGRGFVRKLLAQMLERWPVVLLDMGSVTETADWPWRTLMGRLWQSDAHMWCDLFGEAHWRRPLLVYPFQGGRRVLWKLVGPREKPYEYEELETWRRNESCDPPEKRLLPEGAPGAYAGVEFRKLRRKGTQELFWAKLPRLWRDDPQRHAFEDEVEQVVKRLPVLASVSLERHPQWGRIYPFVADLQASLVVHYCMREQFLSPDHCREAERVAQAVAEEGPLANLPLGLLTDFQCARTAFGLMFFDWEPDHQQPSVEAILAGGEEARRQVQDEVYSPLDLSCLLERSVNGAVLPFPSPTPEESQRLATDLLRRAQLLRRARLWKWAKANYRAALSLGFPAGRAWLRLLVQHWRQRLKRRQR